jgi:CBS domain-containing protein
MKVRDRMTTSVACVRADEPLSAAARQMWDCDCGAIPVIDASTERVVGMVTDRDICMASWSRDQSPSTIAVSEAMSRELFFCSAEDSIASAEQLMREQQIRRLPVLNGDRRLVGILSLADLVTQSGAGNGLKAATSSAAAEAALTLANICQPRVSPQFNARV